MVPSLTAVGSLAGSSKAIRRIPVSSGFGFFLGGIFYDAIRCRGGVDLP